MIPSTTSSPLSRTAIRRAAIAGAILASAACASAAGPSRSYQPLRHDEDWSWLVSDPPETPDAFDRVKYGEISDNWHVTFGGSFRVRLENDWNKLLAGPPILRDSLVRSRAWLHLEIGHEKDFRWFVEVRAAETDDTERPVAALMHDDPDVRNFFLEGTLASRTAHPVSIRAGRQELLFGAQRLISPLDWSNGRRTWDGLSVIAKSPRTKTTIFGTHPVENEPHDIDKAFHDVWFWGVYSTMRPKEGHVVDAYALVLDDARDAYASELGGAKGDMERDTFGARYDFRGKSGWVAETEWALQRGHVSGDDLSAWFGSLTLGYQWKEARWKSKLTAGFDAASGDDDPADGDAGTFNPLFPLGHQYFGHIDLVGRSNVKSARLGFETSPAKGFKWETALHRFWLFDETDALYDAAGKAIRRDATGASGDDVATEVDMLFAYTFLTHHWIGFEICRWWSGDFVQDTGYGDDAWFVWMGYEFRF